MSFQCGYDPEEMMRSMEREKRRKAALRRKLRRFERAAAQRSIGTEYSTCREDEERDEKELVSARKSLYKHLGLEPPR